MNEPAKKEYQAPQLQEVGDLKEITTIIPPSQTF